MSEKIIIKNSTKPMTLNVLEKAFKEIGLKKGMVVLLHSSLSSIGWVCGGAVSVILALENILGPAGTLVMPSHSGNLSDPEKWENPPVPKSWWNIIRNSMPSYERDLTPSFGMGVIAEVFRKQRGVLRSSHPNVSFVAKGKYAKHITANHSLEFAFGEKSPLKKIYDLGGYVLLLGANHLSNTSIHLAENRAHYSKKKIITNGAPVIVDRKRKWIKFKDYEDCTDDFVNIGKDFVKNRTDAVNLGFIGQAESQFFKQQDVVDFAVEWIEKNRK